MNIHNQKYCVYDTIKVFFFLFYYDSLGDISNL